MTTLARFALFLTAFLPINLSLALGLFAQGAARSALFFSFLALVGLVATGWLLFAVRGKKFGGTYEVSEYRYVDNDVVAYLVSFVPVFFASQFDHVALQLSVYLFYAVIAVIYFRLDMYLLNPTLLLLGFRVGKGVVHEDGDVHGIVVVSRVSGDPESVTMQLSELGTTKIFLRISRRPANDTEGR